MFIYCTYIYVYIFMHDRNHVFVAQEVNNTFRNRDCTDQTLSLARGALMVISDGCQATGEDSRTLHDFSPFSVSVLKQFPRLHFGF